MGADTRIAKWDNLKFMLIYLVVLGHFIDFLEEGSGFARGLHLFIYLFHMPAFLFLSGLFSKRTVNERRYDRVAPYLSLYFFMKVFRYIVHSFSDGEAGGLAVFYGTGVPWFALTLFFSYLITIAVSRCDRKYLMILAVSAGIMAGYDTRLNDYLTGMRLFTMYPFFLAGYCTDLRGITEFAGRKAVRLFSALIFLAVFACCWFWQDPLYGYMDFLLGKHSYKELGMLPYGGVCRGAYYILAFLLVFCVIAIAPSVKCLFTGWGTRTLQVYALHYPFIKVLMDNLHLEQRVRELAPVCGDVLFPAAALLLTAALSAGCLSPFFAWLMHPGKAESKTKEMA